MDTIDNTKSFQTALLSLLSLMLVSTFVPVAANELNTVTSTESQAEEVQSPATLLPTNATQLEVEASPTQRRSAIQRLNAARQAQPKLFLPTRFFIGQQQQLVVQGPANASVKVYLSPRGKGFASPEGFSLAVGEEVQTLEGTTNDKGVAILTFDLPENTALDGHYLYVDGVLTGAESPPSQLKWIEPTGRDADTNKVVMTLPSDGSGTAVLPGMPGLGGDMLRRLGTYQDIQKGGDRVKALVDDGDRTGTVYDKNVFITRPDGTGGVGN